MVGRIEEASRDVELDQLCLWPRCRFFSTVEGNVLTREQEADEPRLVVEVADEVWDSPRLAQRATACPSQNVYADRPSLHAVRRPGMQS